MFRFSNNICRTFSSSIQWLPRFNIERSDRARNLQRDRSAWKLRGVVDASRTLTCLQPRRHFAHLPPCQVRIPTANIRLSHFWRREKFPDSRLEITRANEKKIANSDFATRGTSDARAAGRREASTSPSRVILARRSRPGIAPRSNESRRHAVRVIRSRVATRWVTVRFRARYRGPRRFSRFGAAAASIRSRQDVQAFPMEKNNNKGKYGNIKWKKNISAIET